MHHGAIPKDSLCLIWLLLVVSVLCAWGFSNVIIWPHSCQILVWCIIGEGCVSCMPGLAGCHAAAAGGHRRSPAAYNHPHEVRRPGMGLSWAQLQSLLLLFMSGNTLIGKATRSLLYLSEDGILSRLILSQ